MKSSQAYSTPRTTALLLDTVRAITTVLLALALLAAWPELHGRQEAPVMLQKCNVAFHVPLGFQIVEERPTSLLARNTDGMELAFFCTINERRTYRPNEMLAKPGVKRIKEVHLEHQIRGVLYSNARYSGNKKLESIEAYLATRNLEYRVIAIPKDGQFQGEETRARETVEELLARLSWIAPPESTISEEEYQQRFWFLMGLILLVVAASIVFLIRRKKS